MVIDSSALIAIMTGDPERRRFIDAITAAQTRLVAAPTLLEASMVVLSRSGDARLRAADRPAGGAEPSGRLKPPLRGPSGCRA